MAEDHQGPYGLAPEMARLLELRDSAGVPALAAARLAELYGSRPEILRVYPVGAARLAAHADRYAVAPDGPHFDAAAAPVPAEGDLEAAIRSRQPVRAHSSSDGHAMVLPFCVADEVRHLVRLSGGGAKGEGPALAEALLPLFTAFYELLADAETDPLTRLANRRLFYSQLGAGIARFVASPRRWFLALADIDRFKAINDGLGHLYGDEILIHFARLLRRSFRAGDRVYRFGGEEFLIVYAAELHEDRAAPLERFRAMVEDYAFPRVGRVTASIGFTALDHAFTPATTYIDRADRAVYFAKSAGRNRVCEYEALVSDGSLAAVTPEAGGEATLF